MKNPAMKYLACLLTSVMMVATASNVEAKPKNNQKNNAAQQKKEAEKKKEREERERKSAAINDFLNEKDANNDGTVTMSEYLADETDKDAALAKFQKSNKNGDRSLTKTEIADMLGLK
jgi:uncharacterized protein YxeA